ncbi:hypothetical protein DKX38_012778 [Salix brachista]|uniref:Glycoside hydrolase family 19 catalytic domain-containing protein n=1 Tax=Salix brachista TaxID=2182728 RepID=A0A5N5LRU4_9ROSI|nr:hypothetical protein DKX38_012778 [Salix brachista]
MEAKWCIPVTMVLLVVVVSGDSEGKEAAAYQPLGFGTTGGKLMGQKEVAENLMNYNYGKTGEALKIDLLNHPVFIENNATLAFQAAIWKWMTPGKKHQPSAHDAFVGIWKPTKNDTLATRVPGFGTTMNVLYGDKVCGKGDDESMNNIVSHYL